MMKLSPNQRLVLIDHVNGLVDVDFERLVFALNIPHGIIPPNSNAQGKRSSALFHWVENTTGCGLEDFLYILNHVAPLPLELQPFVRSNHQQSIVESLPNSPLLAQSTKVSTPCPTDSPNFGSTPMPRDSRTLDVSLSDSVSLELVEIPPGRFVMGSGRNWCNVELASSFYMGKYPVTQEQWEVVSLLPAVDILLQAGPSRFRGERRPVERVSWHEAKEFCKRASSKCSDGKFSLPHESQWEYACRAKTDTLFHFGNRISTKFANYFPNIIIGFRSRTTDVDQFSPNNFGLHDIHGNVWEWCQDCWHDDLFYGRTADENLWINGGNSRRVIRGGSWFTGPGRCRSTYRESLHPNNRCSYLGFRVVFVPFD